MPTSASWYEKGSVGVNFVFQLLWITRQRAGWCSSTEPSSWWMGESATSSSLRPCVKVMNRTDCVQSQTQIYLISSAARNFSKTFLFSLWAVFIVALNWKALGHFSLKLEDVLLLCLGLQIFTSVQHFGPTFFRKIFSSAICSNVKIETHYFSCNIVIFLFFQDNP